jgi:hypothetical protein
MDCFPSFVLAMNDSRQMHKQSKKVQVSDTTMLNREQLLRQKSVQSLKTNSKPTLKIFKSKEYHLVCGSQHVRWTGDKNNY